jgi:hypothetical protein
MPNVLKQYLRVTASVEYPMASQEYKLKGELSAPSIVFIWGSESKLSKPKIVTLLDPINKSIGGTIEESHAII